MKHCPSCQSEYAESSFTKKASSPDGLSRYCKACQQQKRVERKFNRSRGRVVPTLRTAAEPDPVSSAATDYKPSAELIGTWAAGRLMIRRGKLAPNFLFVGPSGSGKTEAARHLASLASLPITKVDAPSMTDPEAWFGTREVIVEDGAPRTIVTDSAFVVSIQQPGITLIDEVNRVADAVRNILLPLFDDSRAVTNPLTGQPVVRHPENIIIMTGNIGLGFTGTYAIDPALMTRALTTTFDYLDTVAETALAISRTGVDADAAALFVRFADETRTRAKADDDFPPISTREVLAACDLVSVGLDVNTAAHQVIINAASGEGGAESIRADYERIWVGIHA